MSQGELRKGHGADSRLAEAADRLRERIKVCEGEGRTLPSVGTSAEYLKVEASAAEAYAKENNLWIPMFSQQYIRRGVEVDTPEIEDYMLKLGFQKTGDYSYTNGEVTIDDLRPRNVLKDANGTFYIIDAGLKRNL